MLIYCNRRWFFSRKSLHWTELKKIKLFSTQLKFIWYIIARFEGNLYTEINFIFNQIKLLSIMVWLYGLLFIGNLRQKKYAHTVEKISVWRSLAHARWHFVFIVNNMIWASGERVSDFTATRCTNCYLFGFGFFPLIQSGWFSH